jgi:leucyl aminopeptidase
LEKCCLFVPEEFSSNEVEAIVSGLLLGTYNLGHFKREDHPFNPDFELEIISSKDYTSTIDKAIKIARAQLQTLALVDLPPNKVTPKYLGWALDKGKNGFEVNTGFRGL